LSYSSDNKSLGQLSKWGSSSSVRSHWTVNLTQQWFSIGLLLLLVFHWVLASVLPPTEDELYYWTWAQKLQLSYYDHPPMIALLIRISTAIFGQNLFGIRFFATLVHWIVFTALATLTPGKKVLGWVLLTPITLYGIVLMTPDVPFLLFWTLYLLWLVSLNRSYAQWSEDPVSRVYRPSPIHWEVWLLGGVLLGLGLLSKYSMVLAIPCSLLILVTKYRIRSWFKGYLAHLMVAGTLTIPIFVFNSHHHFAPLLFQWNHSLVAGSGVFKEFLGGQVLLVGALPLLMLGWVLVRRSDICSIPAFHVCFYCFVFPFLFCLLQAAKAHVEANWALMSYIAFWPLAQFLLNQNSIQLLEILFLGLGFLPPLLVSLAVAVHLVYPLKWVAPEKDRLAKYREMYHLYQEVVRDLENNGREEILFLPTYQMTAYFRFLGKNAEQLSPLGRESNFTLEPKNPCQFRSVLVVSEVPEPNYEQLKCFTGHQLLKEYPLEIRKKVTSRMYLIEYFRS
jgi:Dolichyl-phosphate-mannose-protein mannosyltransferase